MVSLIFISVLHTLINRIVYVQEPFQKANLSTIPFRFVAGFIIDFHVGLIVVEDVFLQYFFVSLKVFEHISESIASLAEIKYLIVH